jgi:hypothetical protein
MFPWMRLMIKYVGHMNHGKRPEALIAATARFMMEGAGPNQGF